MSKSNYKRLGEYIQEVNVRNVELNVDNLLGINIDKFFMPSVANIVGTDMTAYKILKHGQFACNRMHVGRDKRLPVALSTQSDDVIVSPAYNVFEITDTDQLLPEYLMMWFSRREFDRNAWFYTDADVRGGLNWKDFINMQLPVPSITKQKEIVKEYNVLVDRINLNNRLIQKLEETAQAIYKQWFVDFEFPDVNGNPYKSGGGEMVESELGEMPKGWSVVELQHLAQIKGGKRLPDNEQLVAESTPYPYIKVADMGSSKFVCLNNKFQYLMPSTHKKINRYIVTTGDLIISIVGTIGTVRIIDSSLCGANLTENCVRIFGVKKVTVGYLYHYLYSKNGREEIEMRTVGGVQGKLPLYNIGAMKILIPHDALIAKFSAILAPVDQSLSTTINETGCLTKLRDIILTRISRLP